MQLIVDSAHLGTPEPAWLRFAPLVTAAQLQWPRAGRIVVVAPHPDDEVLALGGTMRALAHRGHELEVIAVTDGEASHPAMCSLAEIRAEERARALSRLRLRARIVRLGIRDGEVAGADGLAERLAIRISDASCVFAPWESDGHPDHNATGLAALRAAEMMSVPLLRYPVWAWHWAQPRRMGALPWPRVRRVVLDSAGRDAKRLAIAEYRSQLEGDAPILPSAVRVRFERPLETVIV